MTLKHSLSFIFCLAFTTIAVWAQNNKFSNSIFRFATRAEGQMLITELDDYTRNWNQFDIDVRLQKPQGRKSQLLQFAMEQTLNWSDAEKERISKAMKSLDAEIKKQSYNLDFPKEIIFVKTTQKEEGNAEAYTRVNWIAIGEHALKEASDADLKYLVAHELFHLLTRQNSNFKKDIYKVIGFTVIEKEIIFPSDLAEIRISNPDISRYDSYGTFTIGGQKQYCTMVIYTDRPYDGKTLFDYLKVGLVPLNGDFVPIQKAGKTIIYALDEAEDFYTQVGKNTNYLIHPEEIMADNFAFTLTGKKDLANPEIIQNVQKVLKAKNR
jgi:hypothetical protein